MKQFYSIFPAYEITPQVGAQIIPQVGSFIFMMPWNHIKLIIDKCNKDKNKALFYVKECLKNNWSRAVLLNQICAILYERQGKALNILRKQFQITLITTTTKESKAKQNGCLLIVLGKHPLLFYNIIILINFLSRKLGTCH